MAQVTGNRLALDALVASVKISAEIVGIVDLLVTAPALATVLNRTLTIKQLRVRLATISAFIDSIETAGDGHAAG